MSRRPSDRASSATAVLEERDPGLQRVRHARPVRLHEQVVNQVDAKVDVLEPGQRVGPVGLGVPRLVLEADRIEVGGSLRFRTSSSCELLGEKISFQL